MRYPAGELPGILLENDRRDKTSLTRRAHQVVHANLVAATKTIAISFALLWRQMRMPVLIAVVDVGSPVIVEVLARAFNAILEPMAPANSPFLVGNLGPEVSGRNRNAKPSKCQERSKSISSFLVNGGGFVT